MALSPEQRFQYAVSVVLDHEGGFSDDKFDPGGKTNFGITQKFSDEHKLGDVRLITKPKAIEIYRNLFWDKYNYNSLDDLSVATKVFDASVNCGATQGAKFLQIAINHLQHTQLFVDGNIGPKTIDLANSLAPFKLMKELRDVMKQFYTNLVMAKPQLERFYDGWVSRASW